MAGMHESRRRKLARGTFEVRLVCAVQAHPPAQVGLHHGEEYKKAWEAYIYAKRSNCEVVYNNAMRPNMIIMMMHDKACLGCLVLQQDDPTVHVRQAEP